MSEEEKNTDSQKKLTDEYKSVIIGKQEWMVENLNDNHFRNGNPILEAKSEEEWIKAGKEQSPAWCYYDNEPENGEKYGKLYNWYAVNDPRGLAPEGWHIPSDDEWSQLIDFCGEKSIADSLMESNSEWGNNNNENSFKALPGGHRDFDGICIGIDKNSNWEDSLTYLY